MLSATGSAIIRAFENCLKPNGDGRYRTYRCPANVVTIGWGTTRDDVPGLKEGDVWSRAQCDQVFDTSISAKYEPALNARLSGVALTQNQRDALLSFIYNVGPGGLDGNVGRAVKDGRHDEVPKYLARWNKGGGRELPGLVRRRKSEGQLYVGNVDGALRTAQTVAPGTMPQSREKPRPSVKDLVRETPKLAAAATGSGGTTAAVPASKAQPTKFELSTGEWVAVALGAALTMALVVVMIRKWRGLAADWA